MTFQEGWSTEDSLDEVVLSDDYEDEEDDDWGDDLADWSCVPDVHSRGARSFPHRTSVAVGSSSCHPDPLLSRTVVENGGDRPQEIPDFGAPP